MSKNTWIIITLTAIVVLILGGSWLYFSNKESKKTISTYQESQSNQSSEKSILLFSFSNPETTGVIDEGSGTVTIVVPLKTDLKKLIPDIIISDGASITPASGVEQDFTSAVVYKITAQDGSTKDFMVTVVPETEGKGS